jgi:hypothetical protein
MIDLPCLFRRFAVVTGRIQLRVRCKPDKPCQSVAAKDTRQTSVSQRVQKQFVYLRMRLLRRRQGATLLLRLRDQRAAILIMIGEVESLELLRSVELLWCGRSLRSRGVVAGVFVVLDFEPQAPIRLLPADLAEDLVAAESAEIRDIGETNRWILADVLGDAGGLTDCIAELVAEDAGGGSVFVEVAGSAGELELVVCPVLLRVEHIGAAVTLAHQSSV